MCFSQNSPWICLQKSRFPEFGLKSTCSVVWDRCTPLQILVFSERRGIHGEWHNFVVTIGIIHLDNAPTEGHYRCILWHSGTVLSCDDFRVTMPLGYDPEVAASIYLIWIVLKCCTNSNWSRPLPTRPKNFDELLSDRLA